MPQRADHAEAMKLRWRAMLVLACGLTLPCAFAPYGWWPLAALSLASLMLLLTSTTPRQAGLLGWIYGVGMFGHGVWWIQVSVHQFGVPYYAFSVPVTALFIVGMALYPALFGYLLQRCRGAGAPLALVAPGLWVLVEMLRAWLFTGFPWLSLGYSQIDAPLAAFAPLLGVFGCSLLVALQAALLASLPQLSWPRRWQSLAAIGAILFAGTTLSGLSFSAPRGQPLTVMLAQGAIPQALKWRPELRERSIALYEDLSAAHWDADVIIWPETAIAAFPHEVAATLERLSEQARTAGTTLLVGMPSGEPWNGRYFNSLLALGATPGRYDKRHLVPFGEFFPFKNAFAPLAMLLDIPLSDFSAGSADQSAVEVDGYTAGISICYEDAYGDEVSAALPQAAFLVNISNDAWFGDTIAPHQHLEIARMRALETARWLLRGTNTGITAIIDHHGKVVQRAPQFQTTVLRGSFQPRGGATPYVRFGEFPTLFLAALLVALSAWFARRARQPAPAR